MNPILIEFYFYKTLPIFPTYKWNYEKYHKVYNKDAFDADFQNMVFNIFKRPLYNFYKESMNGDFFASSAMELNGDDVSFHAEFDNTLFFYLYGSIRASLNSFFETLETNFKDYKDSNGNYRIPIYFYNEHYTYLKQIPSIFEVFKFFIETRTNTIERINDDVFINVDQMKSFEEQYRKYNFA